ncbi:MAG: hypothetical protein KOO60_04545 [Gemmatimonadales bacterium]|nr:hypothetical protein [Gemmatimonadales bacterium]
MKPEDSSFTLLVAPPTFLDRWRNRVLLVAILLVPFFVPIPRSLQFHVVIAEFGDRLHVVLLGGVTFFLYWYGPLRGKLLRSVVAAAIVGGMIELLQTLVGRHALWHDFFQDLIGIGIATGFLLWRGKGSRPGLSLMIVLMLLVPYQMRELPWKVSAVRVCRDRFPLLADFEHPHEKYIWYEEDDSTQHFLVSDEEHGGVQRVETGPSDSWPGVVMRRFPNDWTGFNRLLVDIRLTEADRDTVPGGIVISDFEGLREAAWKTGSFAATRQWQTVGVSLDDLSLDNADRELDISDIFSLKIFLSRPTGHTMLEIDNLRLE